MLELVPSLKKNPSQKKLNLIEMIKKDPYLRDFFKFVHEEDLRERAHQLITEQMKKSAASSRHTAKR